MAHRYAWRCAIHWDPGHSAAPKQHPYQRHPHRLRSNSGGHSRLARRSPGTRGSRPVIRDACLPPLHSSTSDLPSCQQLANSCWRICRLPALARNSAPDARRLSGPRTGSLPTAVDWVNDQSESATCRPRPYRAGIPYRDRLGRGRSRRRRRETSLSHTDGRGTPTAMASRTSSN